MNPEVVDDSPEVVDDSPDGVDESPDVVDESPVGGLKDMDAEPEVELGNGLEVDCIAEVVEVTAFVAVDPPGVADTP